MFFSSRPKDKADIAIIKMNQAIQQRGRGPDSNNIWQDNKTNLLLGHCRLAIQDISSAGTTPNVVRTSKW